jgi:hypothetical protein
MPDTKMTKSAGEHWVCSVLGRLGWGPALTRDGLERTDILAVRSTETSRIVEIHVKAASAQQRSESTNWLINTKAPQLALSEREWFVFSCSQPPVGKLHGASWSRAITYPLRPGLSTRTGAPTHQ